MVKYIIKIVYWICEVIKLDDKAELKEIGQRIRKVRLSKGMTQNDLAFDAHISPSNVSDIELGKTNIWLTTFAKIVEALQVSSDVILRTDIPEVNSIYKREFSELLDDCSPTEIESIMKIVMQIKSTLHKQKKDEDY